MLSVRFAYIFLLILLTGCQKAAPDNHASLRDAWARPVQFIPLPPPLNATSAEFSSLTWCEDQLILLPQFPAGEAALDNSPQLYSIPREQLSTFLDNPADNPLPFKDIPINTDSLHAGIQGFEGFEAVLFYGNKVFLTIESRQGSRMRGYLVNGSVAPGCSSIRLNASSLLPLPGQTGRPGFTYEALARIGDSLLVLHEASGARVNESPTAFMVDMSLQTMRPISFPSLEYRVTDAAGADREGQFWIINYYYPGEKDILQPVADPLLSRFSSPIDTAKSRVVERLVQLQYHPVGITLTDTPPIYIQRSSPDLPARNWEGLALWPGKGFFIVTDTYPETMLAFVPLRAQSKPPPSRAE